MRRAIVDQFKHSLNVHDLILSDGNLINKIEVVVNAAICSLRKGGKLLFMGNGGSAADCQHLAGELVSRFAYDRPGLTAFALTTDSSVMTAIGNDYSFQNLFARQIEAVAKEGDVIFGLSTSGKSENIVRGFESANRLGLTTVAMTGNKGGGIVELVDYCIEIPTSSTPRIQEGHILVGHVICSLIESQVFPRVNGSCKEPATNTSSNLMLDSIS